MKKRSPAARPLLLRTPSYLISPYLLSRLGEALIIASLVVILFFNTWFGILTLLIGIVAATKGYLLARPQMSAQLRAQLLKAAGSVSKRLRPRS